MSSLEYSSQVNTKHPPNASTRAFTVFPKLPPELQHLIWKLACEDETKMPPRIFSFAQDHSGLLQLGTWAEICRHELRILSHKHPIPAVFQACRYSRYIAMKDYTEWPCADPETGEKVKYKVFVRLNIDIFFFDAEEIEYFPYLHMLVDPDVVDLDEEDNEPDPNFHKISMIIKAAPIEHMVFNLILWGHIMQHDATWISDVPKLKRITVLFDICHDAKVHKVRGPVTGLRLPREGTIINRCANEIGSLSLDRYIGHRVGKGRKISIDVMVADRGCNCVEVWDAPSSSNFVDEAGDFCALMRALW